MKQVKIISICAILTALTACSVSPEQCDPSVETSVWNKMACTSSGTYDHRVQQKEQALQSEQAKNATLNQTYANTQQQVTASQRKVVQKKAELAKLNKSVTAYTAQLKQKAKGKEDVLAEIKKVEQELNNINSSSATDEAKQAEIKALKHKLEVLQAASGI